MTKGTIKTLIRDRGFGFINAEDGREIFFHRNELVKAEFDSLHEGDKVEFEVEKGPKGPKATGISVSATEE
ncbi:cold shock domain-containing protein [candidate division TA06 bacterium]|nr:cold shock domain-containing protein [candidate division TA06 bacterium]